MGWATLHFSSWSFRKAARSVGLTCGWEARHRERKPGTERGKRGLPTVSGAQGKAVVTEEFGRVTEFRLHPRLGSMET